MPNPTHASARHTRRTLPALAALSVTLMALSACVPVPPPNGNNNGNNGSGTVSASIVAPSANFGVSKLDPPFSVIYSVTGTPTRIEGFYVEVADSDPSSDPISDPVIVAQNLPAGQQRIFNINPGTLPLGFYRAGILVTVGQTVLRRESIGVIEVQGPPDPRFILPNQVVTAVTRGTDVLVSFDAGDPEGNAQWRLFYLSSTDSRTAPLDRLGTQLAIGAGNFGSFTFETDSLLPGDYELGLSATDSGFSVAITVQRGESHRVISIPNETTFGPIVRVTIP